MTGYDFYKLHIPLKLHFTSEKFNVFKNPNAKISLQSYEKRNDRFLFEKIATKFKDSKEIVRYIISNITSNNFNYLYNYEESKQNYTNWLKRKSNNYYFFEEDIKKVISLDMELFNIYFSLSRFDIHINTFLFLDIINNLVEKWKTKCFSALSKDLLILKKYHGFVNINRDKILNILNKYNISNI